MPKVKLDKLKEGMVVAVDVRNMDDMLLIPSGGVLSGRSIQILQTWGVSEVDVESSEEAEAEADPLARLAPAVVAQITSELRDRFWGFDENIPMHQAVFRAALCRRARQLLTK
jgi:hypothetical protein